MSYKVNPHGLIRDKSYPSEIAAQRPLLATRIHCEEDWHERMGSEELSIRGDQGYRPPHMEPPVSSEPPYGSITENRCAEFNRALRAGQGFRNEGEE